MNPVHLQVPGIVYGIYVGIRRPGVKGRGGRDGGWSEKPS